MTRPVHQARRIILRSVAPSPPPLPLEALAGAVEATPTPRQEVTEEELLSLRDSVIPDSFIRDLRAVVGDPAIPPDAKLPDLDSWLQHEVPSAQEVSGPHLDSERLALELQLLAGFLRSLFSVSEAQPERKLHPALDINEPLEELPVLAPPQLSILRWLWLALLCG